MLEDRGRYGLFALSHLAPWPSNIFRAQEELPGIVSRKGKRLETGDLGKWDPRSKNSITLMEIDWGGRQRQSRQENTVGQTAALSSQKPRQHGP